MLEFIVFISGALVMVLEMVGARVMAPHLGTSAIVWTSLIGVVLACLATGAWMGGRLADSKLSRATLAQILAGAAVGCALTALAHPIVGRAITATIPNIYMAAVMAAVCIFALPATLFGMVTPYVIRLCLGNIATSGATIGRLYALSTMGSIVGTFLGGFVLVSWFASTHILLGTSAGMFVLSLLAWATKPRVRLASLVLIGLGLWGVRSYDTWLAQQGIPPLVETPYNCIRLLDTHERTGRPVRVIATDPGYMQSGMYLDKPTELLFEYTRYYALGTVLFPHAHRVLMLGGGGYSVPKWLLAGHGGLKSDALRLTVVELDPGMTRIARQHFALPEDPRMTIIHEDARRFLNTNTRLFDLVFVDVFNSYYSVPFHMGTVEAAMALRRAVAPDGALVMNIISAFTGKDGHLFRAIHAALSTAFAKVYVFAVSNPHSLDTVQNFMVIALPVENPAVAARIAGTDNTSLSAPIRAMLATHVNTPVPTGTLPLTDDFAPVERYTQALLRK